MRQNHILVLVFSLAFIAIALVTSTNASLYVKALSTFGLLTTAGLTTTKWINSLSSVR